MERQVRERSARSVPMGRNTGRSSFSGGARTPDSLSDNESTLPRPVRKGSAPPRSSLTPGQFKKYWGSRLLSLIEMAFLTFYTLLRTNSVWNLVLQNCNTNKRSTVKYPDFLILPTLDFMNFFYEKKFMKSNEQLTFVSSAVSVWSTWEFNFNLQSFTLGTVFREQTTYLTSGITAQN